MITGNKIVLAWLISMVAIGTVVNWPYLTSSRKDKAKETHRDKITAFTMGWCHLATEPVYVTYTDPPQVHDNIGLMRVMFAMDYPGSCATALVNPGQMPESITPSTNKWKKGDQILVVSIPGRGLTNESSRTYFVIDYRPIGTNAESESK